jgi:hypothetical protein
MQRTQETGAIEWHRLDASKPPDVVLEDAMVLLRRRFGGALKSGWRPTR